MSSSSSVSPGQSRLSAAKPILRVAGIVLAIAVLVIAAYVAYVALTYSRIADNVSLDVQTPSAQAGDSADASNADSGALQVGREYTATTYNIGFGAYTPDYTFFMDEGRMADGTKTVGEHAKAVSKSSVENCTSGAINAIKSENPDFALFQEVDTDSDRSWHVNQLDAITDAFGQMNSVFAQNLHSANLLYPLNDPIGTMNSGILTLSGCGIDSAVRRSYPISDAFPTKFFDLDRCFAVVRIPVEGTDKQLVLINSHMSAYDEGGVFRAQQMELLMGVMRQEAQAGNWVIAGGDWNHALCGSQDMYVSQQQIPDWLAVFDDEDLPEGFSVVRADNIEDVPTCRDDDIPYAPGVTYTSTVDGFLVSGNVDAQAENLDTGFACSDHNPVKLTFKLV